MTARAMIAVVLALAAPGLLAQQVVDFAGNIPADHTRYYLFTLDVGSPATAADVQAVANVSTGGAQLRLIDVRQYAELAQPYQDAVTTTGPGPVTLSLSLPARVYSNKLVLEVRAPAPNAVITGQITTTAGTLLPPSERDSILQLAPGFGVACVLNCMILFDVAHDPDQNGPFEFYVSTSHGYGRLAAAMSTENMRSFVILDRYTNTSSVEILNAQPALPQGNVLESRALRSDKKAHLHIISVSAPRSSLTAAYRGEIVFSDVSWVGEDPPPVFKPVPLGCAGIVISALTDLTRMVPLGGLVAVCAIAAFWLRRRTSSQAHAWLAAA